MAQDDFGTELTPDDLELPQHRRRTDLVSPMQIELLRTQVLGRLDQMETKLLARIEKIESASEFNDRQLATQILAANTRIDGVDKRLDSFDKNVTKIEEKAQNNFKLVLTGLIYPVLVGLIIAILLKGHVG